MARRYVYRAEYMKMSHKMNEAKAERREAGRSRMRYPYFPPYR